MGQTRTLTLLKGKSLTPRKENNLNVISPETEHTTHTTSVQESLTLSVSPVYAPTPMGRILLPWTEKKLEHRNSSA